MRRKHKMKGTITIIPFDDSHLSEAVEIYNHYVEHSTVTFQEKQLSAEEFHRQVLFDDSRFCTFAMVDAEQHRLAGYCVLGEWKSRCSYRRTAEVSIYMRDEYTGRGVGGGAISMLEAKAQKEGFHALMGEVCEENTASIKLMERRGYKRVGHLREVGFKFGRYLDVVVYEKILPVSDKMSPPR
jgi:phosphinothricin acetyltransferase